MSSRKVFRNAIIGVFAVFAAILIFDFCRFSIHSIKCWSSEYGPRYYLARCPQAPIDGYEAEAIYYGIESGMPTAIRNAQVIFLGTSRLEQAFSTKATADYFAKQKIRYYVLGFAFQNAGFVLPVLKRRRASPSLLIVNADPFFINDQAPETRSLVSGGLRIYWALAKKVGLLRLQRAICPNFPSFCSPPMQTLYRSATTGKLRWRGSYLPEQSIPFTPLLQHDFSDDQFKAAVDFGERFLREIAIHRSFLLEYRTMGWTHLR